MPDETPSSPTGTASAATGEREATAAVVAFLNRYLADRAAGIRRDLADYQAMCPAHAVAIAREHVLLESSQEALGLPDCEARYRPLADIAHGGMGRVVKVWDRDLARELAMKTLRDDEVGSPRATPAVDAAARLMAEARITGQLQHPGIVPVHEVGLGAHGMPFFTMAVVRGSSLAAVIDELHRHTQPRESGAPSWTLSRVVDVLVRVGEAVAFAHSRGFVHRDLKPANVMVGEFGEVYVLDWGLAKRMDGGDLPTGPGPALPDCVSLTSAGDVLGTPPYMAPEQARGEVERVGPAADVYSIGAMLYHVLAGHMPYGEAGADTSSRAVHARVCEGPPPPLSASCARAPAELVAVCEKAMARDSAARYPTVARLADDLRAFRDLRVVRAYEAGAMAELRKWVRRNRLAAAAAAAAVLTLGTGLVVSLLLRQEADAHAARAESGYTTALDAVDRLLMRIGEHSFRGMPGTEEVFRETVRDARDFYLQFLSTHGQRPGLEKRTALAHWRLGWAHKSLGDWDAAHAEFTAGVACFAKLLADDPDRAEAAAPLARCWQQIGYVEVLRGRHAGAEQALAQGLAVVGQALLRHPQDLQLQACKASLHMELGFHLAEQDKDDEALEHLQCSVELGEELVQRSDDQGMRQTLARGEGLRTHVLTKLGRTGDAAVAVKRTLQQIESLLAGKPRDPDLRNMLGNAHGSLEYMIHSGNDEQAAWAANERALAIFAELAAEFPRMPEYHSNLAAQLNNRALLYRRRAELDAALADLDQAIVHQRLALAAAPSTAMFRHYMHNHLRTRLFVLAQMGRHQQVAADVDALLDRDRGSAKNWLDAGKALLMAVAAAAADATLGGAERARVGAALVERGVGYVRQAMALGFCDRTQLLGPEYEAARESPAMLALLADLEQAAQESERKRKERTAR